MSAAKKPPGKSLAKTAPKKMESSGDMHFGARAEGGAMKTVFMTAGNSSAIIATRTGKKMRRRMVKFPDAHAALDWCLDRRATFVLVPAAADPKLN